MSGKQNVDLKNVLFSIGIGVLVSALVSAVFLLLEAALILNETIGLSGTAVVAVGIHIVSAYIGCLVAEKRAKNAALIAIAGVSLASILLHMVISILLLDGSIGHVLRVLLPEILGCGLALLTLTGKGRNRKTRKVMKRYL